jgi:hypothetical protein
MSSRTLLPTLAALSLLPVVVGQEAGPITATQLKDMIVGLNYDVRSLNEEPGKEKYEFTVKTAEYDVPIAAEISGSKNYIWLTVFLGDAPKADSPKCHALLQRNFRIQPCQFYVTERGALMLGMAMENRAVSAGVLSRTVRKVSEDVIGTADVWGTQ